MIFIKVPFRIRRAGGRITLLEIVLVLIVIGLMAGAIIVSRQMLDSSKLRSQVAQIGLFDSAVSTFNEKYDGLPGDLLAAKADMEGLAHGDGKPAHGDGDGKISPCNPGWQSSFGCETALFWSHLSEAGLIPQEFRSNNTFADNRMEVSRLLDVYLPQSPLSDDIFITVWNTDDSFPSPGKPLPYGNYYEISRIIDVVHEKMRDNEQAITPTQARAIDNKIDDGYPLTGRVVVNGTDNWPTDAWGSYATPGPDKCIADNETYNTRIFSNAHKPLCHLAISLNCCGHRGDR